MTDTTQPITPSTEEVKQSIPEKVDELNKEKSTLTSQLNSMPEGAEKTAAQERISVIDRKLRWYAGRSGASKKAGAERPTKAKRASKKEAAKPEELVQPNSAANEV